MTNKSHAQLSAHIARIEGQLAGARDALEQDDCAKVARTLLAASRSLASVRATCASEFLERKVYRNAKVSDASLLADIRALIKA